MRATGGTGTALRALRQTAGLSLREVSSAAGVSLSYLSRVETGKEMPSDKWVRMVTDVIGCQIEAAA